MSWFKKIYLLFLLAKIYVCYFYWVKYLIYLLAKNVLFPQVINLDRSGQLMRNFYHPVRKDTVTIPDGGYTVVRFIADNPGETLMKTL